VEETNTDIQTFTVGFSDADIVDERPFARLASDCFKTRHRELTISAGDFAAFLPQYVWHMEEPVCEPPAIALYYIARLARQHVKVLLSGEGGDEAFAGYPEYRNYPAFERFKALAGPVRGAAKAAFGLAGRITGDERLARYAALFDLQPSDYYLSRVTSPHDYFNRNKTSLYSDALASTVSSGRSSEVTRTLFQRTAGAHLLNQMLYVDAKSWLPDDLLVKADKMTMATSVELRVPFLDHTVLEFAAGLPPEFKVMAHKTKRVLREAFRTRVPPAILTRKKAGFPVPYARWLARDLRQLVRDTVLSSRAMARGYFRKDVLTSLLDENSRPSVPAREIFSLLVLELWHRQFADDHDFAYAPSPDEPLRTVARR
jgi:asparagine synthase (glutamine-hydrolysing)